MFGYVTPYRPEMKECEYNLFKAYYCGLCKTIGSEYNQLARMGLNYDLSFLSLLLSSLEEKRDYSKLERCIAHPINKRIVIKKNRALTYTSSMSIMLIYFKLLDDWHDDKSIKALFASVPFSMAIKKVKAENDFKFNTIKSKLEDISKLEVSKCSEVDEVADVFAKIMGEVATPKFIKDKSTLRILSSLGYNLGRWIYIVDAFDDIEDDIKNNSYNPLLLQYQYKYGEDINCFIKKVESSIETTLTFTLDNISKSFELLDIKHNRKILENIIYLGMRREMEKIFNRNKGD